MTTVLNEVQGKTTTLRNISDPLPVCGTSKPTATDVVYGKPGCAGVGGFFSSNPTTLNFEPRFGFAWDPRGDGKMAVRGGFAIFDILPLPGYFYTQQGIETPFLEVGTVTTSAANPLAGIGVLAADPKSACNRLGPASLT